MTTTETDKTKMTKRPRLDDGDTFDYQGRTFTFQTRYDDSGDAPWENSTPLGEVSEWTDRDKRPGERILTTDRGSHRYYDFAGAVESAKKEGCRPSADWTGTAGEGAVIVVENEFKRFSAWCRDEWHYVGVIVTDTLSGESESLWGIEDDSDNSYFWEVAEELAGEIIHTLEMNQAKTNKFYESIGIKVKVSA